MQRHLEAGMTIGVFYYPDELTAEQYGEVLSRLEAAGQGAPKGRRHHFAFGDESSLMVVDIFDSQEDFAAFGEVLMPILEELGIEGEPGLLELHNSITG
jgi:hypothetical protein